MSDSVRPHKRHATWGLTKQPSHDTHTHTHTHTYIFSVVLVQKDGTNSTQSSMYIPPPACDLWHTISPIHILPQCGLFVKISKPILTIHYLLKLTVYILCVVCSKSLTKVPLQCCTEQLHLPESPLCLTYLRNRKGNNIL